jgi:hypothetical protein
MYLSALQGQFRAPANPHISLSRKSTIPSALKGSGCKRNRGVAVRVVARRVSAQMDARTAFPIDLGVLEIRRLVRRREKVEKLQAHTWDYASCSSGLEIQCLDRRPPRDDKFLEA